MLYILCIQKGGAVSRIVCKMDLAEPIGLVGLGMLGGAIAARLQALGHQLVVHDRRHEATDAAVSAGAEFAARPDELAEQCRLIMVCVLDDKAVEEVTLGRNGISQANRWPEYVVDFSSNRPQTARRMAEVIGAKGGVWIDAPVSGGPEAATEGVLTIMAGGTKAGFAAVAPILRKLGRNVTHVGPVGAGQEAKVLNQFLVGAQYVMMAELLTMARASSVDAEKLPAILAGGLADSRILQFIYPMMHEDIFDRPLGRVQQLNKDLQSVRAQISALELTLPLAETAIEQYAKFTHAGNEMEDSASVSRLYRGNANTKQI